MVFLHSEISSTNRKNKNLKLKMNKKLFIILLVVLCASLVWPMVINSVEGVLNKDHCVVSNIALFNYA